MGLFSGSKKIYVSSSVYNLAGDESNRPNFLKTTMFAAVMNPYDTYLGEAIVGNYLDGPGIMQRSFFNWAVRRDLAGLPTISTRNSLSIDHDIVEPLITVPASPTGLVTHVQKAQLTDGDYTYWSEKWIMENEPTENGTDWVSDYNAVTHEITVQFVNGDAETFSATNFDKNKQFVIATYYQAVPTSTEPLETGATTTDVFSTPSTAGYSVESTTNTGVVSHNMSNTVTVRKEYSDGSPTTTNTTYPNETLTYNGVETVHNRTDFVGGNGDSPETSDIEKWLHIFERRQKYNDTETTTQVNDMGGGETETVTTTKTGDFLRAIYDWREDTQETINEKIDGNVKMYIYELGTGESTLDDLTSEQIEGGAPEYYPFLPIRLNNKSITDDRYANVDNSSTYVADGERLNIAPFGSGLYEETTKAYKKATKNQKLDKVIEQVEDNPDLGDIDYCYLQWGISVNVIQPAGKTYLYTFFKNLINEQNTSASTMNSYKNSITNFQANKQAMEDWTAAQNVWNHPLYQTPKPQQPILADPESTTVRLKSDNDQLSGFDNRYTWVSIVEENFTGVGRVDAVERDCWFVVGENLEWDIYGGYFTRGGDDVRSVTNRSLDQVYMYKQTGANTYSRLTIWGMVHNNYIYGGKAVRITLTEGIEDNDESPFIVPYHAPSVAAMGIKDYTQLATANTWLTFNSYLVVKKKWYQTFLGMLLIIVAIVVIAVLIAPVALGASSGVLGTNAAVGASFGLTGTAAVVAGAVTNAIAGVIIAQAVGAVSVAIFGEKWGAIIGAIVSFAISFGMSNGFGNMSLNTMMTPRTLLSFSSALANGYNGFVQAEVGEMQSEMSKNQEEFDRRAEEIDQMMKDQGLVNDLLFDPMTLTDLGKGNGRSGELGSYIPESLSQFISRTTMTGTDIVEITLSMVTDYAELQRTLPKA